MRPLFPAKDHTFKAAAQKSFFVENLCDDHIAGDRREKGKRLNKFKGSSQILKMKRRDFFVYTDSVQQPFYFE